MVVRRSCPPRVVHVLCWMILACGSPALAGDKVEARPLAPAAETLASPPQSFAVISARASRAREAGAAAEAIGWYRRGLRIRPRWDEGWWYLATLLYEGDRYAESRDAFTRFLRLKPEPGPARALRGLCEFRLEDYATALVDLDRWASDGTRGNEEIGLSALYHLSILRIRAGQFELAFAPMVRLCHLEPESPRLVRAAGLMLLRMKSLPDQVPEDRVPMVDAAGRAAYFWLAQKNEEARARFGELIARFPEAPNAHYCYGLLLRSLGSPEALAQFQEEIRVQPRSVYPRLEMAFELLKRGDDAAALPYAEDSARLAPSLFAAHHALGRVLVEVGQVERGIRELELAARLAPESPEMFHALFRAYDKAGRGADAERARAAFLRLEARRRVNETQPLAQGPPGPGATNVGQRP